MFAPQIMITTRLFSRGDFHFCFFGEGEGKHTHVCVSIRYRIVTVRTFQIKLAYFEASESTIKNAVGAHIWFFNVNSIPLYLDN